MTPQDDDTPRHKLGTTIYKSFDGDEYKGKIINYDHNYQLYKILYEDGDSEELWHDEVTKLLQPGEKPKLRKLQHVDKILAKLAPTELDEDTHTATFDMTTLRAITALQHGDAITDAITDEDILVSIQTIGSNSTTAEEQALGRLTRRKLKTLSNWKE